MLGLFNKILYPSVVLLNRLKFTWKFALIFGLYLIPVVYVLFVSLTEHTIAVEQAKLERKGVHYMASLRPLFEHMAQTRGMTNAYLNGKTELQEKILAERSIVNKSLAGLMNTDALYGITLNTTEMAKSIQADWSHVVKNAFTMNAANAFTAHTDVIQQVLALKSHILETSKLLLDPSLDSNFMASTLSKRIPTLAENMGKARGLGAGIVAKGSFTPELYLKLVGFIQTIESANNSMMHGLDVVFENNSDVQEKLSSLRNSANTATQSFVQYTRKNIIEPDTINIDAASYFTKGTEAITANLKLYDAVLPVLDELLLSRISHLKNKILMNISSSVLLLLGALYLFAGFNRSLMGSINRIKVAVHSMAEGDLTAEVKIDANDEMQLIATDMNMMIERTNALVSQVISAANQVVISSDQSSATSEDARDGVNQQNQQLELIATAMNEMSATVHEVANNAASAAEATRNADTEANNGRAVVHQTIQSINELSNEMKQASSVIKQLENDSESIGSVLDVIRGIAEQTNLLALNAAIEAARAGEQGRGFAVVADEVRTLASRTQDSTQEIQTMIEKLQQGARNAVKVMDDGNKQTEKTVSQAAEAGATLESITTAVNHITSMNEQIASAAEEQSSVAEEINRNVVNVRDIAEQTVNNANKTAESSVSLKTVASQLNNLVAEFKVN
ncbi:MAG: methyl-accepting chemotaxis protein [Gammaproteobacteria bacterium]|nr:methyl-accepting chemotaxis protein [Gammaproteobacteria bacterium]MCW8986469.1 methyl-accepting chemotaxis protein [Gammaproteobacteria bacterium]